ncbi:cyclic peptide export ABC transporter [Methylovulum psychrotolerans]|uniref:Cyclic peptide export ABC transporter n=1 Tax=Methylovulum psychrotolerans TaxID=1704499 RepID=A0A2S5CMG4_9GAMM|nr:cyclic peptide export ABC transporter [Methylovulum psychrotolerans]POZ52013.1 cyclic peptide export ABC transporter [Methylovulum psychrotolerans]
MMFFLLRNSGWLLIFSMSSGLLAGLSGAGLIAVINMALDSKQSTLPQLGKLFAELCALLFLARIGSAFLLMRLGQNVIFNLRLKLSRQILRTSFPHLQAIGPARILACLTQDIATFAEAFQWLPMLCVNAAIIGGCLLYLGWLSGTLLVIVILAIIVGIGGIQLVESHAQHRLSMARESDDKLYGHFRSLTQGMKELKLHELRRNAFLTDRLEVAAKNYRQHYLQGNGFYILAGNWGNILFYLLIGTALFLLPNIREAVAGLSTLACLDVVKLPAWPDMTPEIVRGYCLTILYMMFPLATLMDGVPVWVRGSIALKKIEALTWDSCEPESAETSGSLSFADPEVLMLNGVTHRYRREGEDRPFTLGPLDLTLQPGEVVFLIGGNGSGKTTLALLLVGLYVPEQGEIRLGGQRISETNRESYRQQFSAVFSDFYLFDSLLGFQGKELDTEARVYLARLQLDHKVSIENGEFSTLDLSQGQRKRLALLVAYLEDRPFYLFDEWAADQDPIFKKIFYTELLPLLKAKGKTVIVISHDDHYFYMADRCLKIEDGALKAIVAESPIYERAEEGLTGDAPIVSN